MMRGARALIHLQPSCRTGYDFEWIRSFGRARPGRGNYRVATHGAHPERHGEHLRPVSRCKQRMRICFGVGGSLGIVRKGPPPGTPSRRTRLNGCCDARERSWLQRGSCKRDEPPCSAWRRAAGPHTQYGLERPLLGRIKAERPYRRALLSIKLDCIGAIVQQVNSVQIGIGRPFNDELTRVGRQRKCAYYVCGVLGPTRTCVRGALHGACRERPPHDCEEAEEHK